MLVTKYSYPPFVGRVYIREPLLRTSRGVNYMGLEKAIASGQEHRKPYHGAMTVCFNCRNHGTCDYCRGNRLYGARKREAAADERQDEYEAYVCSGEVSTADAFYEDRLRAKHKPVIRGVVQITGPSAFVGCAGQARERKVLTACRRRDFCSSAGPPALPRPAWRPKDRCRQ